MRKLIYFLFFAVSLNAQVTFQRGSLKWVWAYTKQSNYADYDGSAIKFDYASTNGRWWMRQFDEAGNETFTLDTLGVLFSSGSHPRTASTYNLGTSALPWDTVHANVFSGMLDGSFMIGEDLDFNGYYSIAHQNISDLGSGIVGNAYSFDGVNDKITSTNVTQLSGEKGTLCAWVNLDDLTVGNAPVFTATNNASDTQIFSLRFISGNLEISGYSGTNDRVQADGAITAESWHFVAVTSDGSSYSLYIDGELQDVTVVEGSNSGRWFDDISGINNWGIGYRKRLADEAFFNGSIVGVGLFNNCLTAAEVKALYSGAQIPDKYVGASQTALTSGTLTIGKQYTIDTFVAGDDFTNVGGTNSSGTTFTATGTTPTTWTNSSSLRATGNVLNLSSDKTPGTWYDKSGNGLNGTVSGATLINEDVWGYFSGGLEVDGDIYLSDDIFHSDDTDTKVVFDEDRIRLFAGNEQLMDLRETTQTYVKLGDGGDVDINLNDNLLVEGSSGDVSIPNGKAAIGASSGDSTLYVSGGGHLTGGLKVDGFIHVGEATHLFSFYGDSTISKTYSTSWQHLTNGFGTMWDYSETDGFTVSNDTITVLAAGDYDLTAKNTLDGDNGETQSIRFYNVTQAAGIPTAAAITTRGANNFGSITVSSYATFAANDKIVLQYKSDGAGTSVYKNGTIKIYKVHE